MPRSNRWGDGIHRLLRSGIRRLRDDERGSAALEFITIGVILLVPLVYLVLALGQVQGQSLGAEAAARHIARALATAPDADAAQSRADAVLRSVIDEYAMDTETVELRIDCRPAATVCPDAGSTVVVTIAARVSLPLVPSVLGLDRIASVPIEAQALQKVSRFWGSG